MSTPPSGTEGIGRARWGDTRWGSGLTPLALPPVITPLDPIDGAVDIAPSTPIFLRLTDDAFVDQATLQITVGATIYVLGGVAQNGAILVVALNGGGGFDIDLRLPAALSGGSVEVQVAVRDQQGNQAVRQYGFYVGVGLRLVQVRNPAPNILVAYFNRSLRQDDDLRFVPNWAIQAVSVGAAPLAIVEVVTNATHTNLVTLRYRGGGSVYRLLASRVLDAGGTPISLAFSSALFEILFGDEPAPTVRLFDTIQGPVGIVHQVGLRRTMDGHVINRSLALGMSEQFRLQARTLDGSVGRDGRPGKNRL